MKFTKNILGFVILILAIGTSCVDDSPLLYNVEKPLTLEQIEYLNSYDALKTYINKSTSPNFKLGAGVTASEYIKQGFLYRFINSNFDQITAGNEMKYASVVKDNGTMDFSQVIQFVAAAKAANMSIYGHTLLWHAQQNNKYLNSIIADKPIVIDPSKANNALHIKTTEAKANTWDWQIFYNLQTPLTTGVEYTLKMRVKASAPFTLEKDLLSGICA